MGIKDDLLSLSDFAWQRLWRRLEGVTDEEYLWEPAPGCWTVRPAGDGSFRGDWGVIVDEDPPFTTIAWRLGHIVYCLTPANWPPLLAVPPAQSLLADGLPGTAVEALELLRRAYDVWRGYVAAAAEDELSTKLGAQAGQYAEETRTALVLHVLDELIHHGAEVGVLRDLYRATRPQDGFVAACLSGDRSAIESVRAADAGVVERTRTDDPNLMVRAAETGRWQAIPLLAELGFSIEGTMGRTALHHAAGAGALETVTTLVGLGADVNARDPVYDATPLGWAQYFRQNAVARYLEGLTAETVSS